jgi:hypothetical protein
MVVGFNHNFRYKDEVYHIQTEDSGVKSPNIVTLLYQGGTILASKKTSYADISKVDNLEQVVEELMKEQHKGMLRGLKSGEYDAVIERHKYGKTEASCRTKASGRTETPQASVEEEISKPQVEVEPAGDALVESARIEDERVAVEPVVAEPVAVEPPPPPVPPVAVNIPPAVALKPEPETAPKTPPPTVPAEKTPSPVVEIGLDEVILSYLMGDDKEGGNR